MTTGRHYSAIPIIGTKVNRREKNIDPLILQGYDPIGIGTVRNIIGPVSSAFNWLVKQGYSDENPVLGVAPRRVHSARS